MLRRVYEPDKIPYTELIRGFRMRGHVKEAEELLSWLQRSGSSIDHIFIQKDCRARMSG